MNMKKIVASAAALSLTAAVAVGGTLAWLQDSSDTITNTFVWNDDNNITLTLTETGAVDNEKEYTIVPGATQDKDPTLHLTTATESYVYVVIDNQLGSDVTMNGLDTNWTAITNSNSKITGTVYTWKTGKTTSNNDMSVFDTITYSNALNAETGNSLNGKKIVITGYAVQASAGADAQAAWNATFGKTATTEP